MDSVGNASGRPPGPGIYPTSRLERAFVVAAIAIASFGLGYLFFVELWWKAPPDFGCNADFSNRGLCYWVNREAELADEPPFTRFNANIIRSEPGPEVALPVGLAKSLNGAFVESVVQPNIRYMGYVLWGTEAFAFLSLCLGLFSRLGALAALGVSTHLMLGLGGAPNEWEWSYQLMMLLSIAMLGIAPGRYFGLDRLLRPRLWALRERGSRLSGLLLALT
jgi:hypothetical protein